MTLHRFASTRMAAPLAAGVLLALAWSVLLSGCASSSRQGIGDPNTPTGGVAIEFDNRDTAALRVIFATVSAEGTLAIGGGADGFNQRTTWSGTLTAEQAEALRTILREDGWTDGTVFASGTPKSKIARVTIRSGAGRQSYSLIGESEAVDRLDAFLCGASRARFDHFMRMLPEPSAPR